MFEISQEDIEKGEDVARCPSLLADAQGHHAGGGQGRGHHDARPDDGHRGGLSIIASTTILGTR